MAKFVHPTACVEDNVTFGEDVKIWNFCHVRKGAKLGDFVSVGKDSYIDANVEVGRGSRIQNQVNVYAGVKIHNWCFIGPAVVFTNDQFPRVGNKTWKVVETEVQNGASIGAGAVIRCGISIGAFAMVGAGAIVTKNVPPFCLMLGFPAQDIKRICACGQTTLPLDTLPQKYIQPCCQETMSPETFELAQSEIKKLLER
jgi:acetyltransferase-like isoleucine patch superfamily enzyme